MSKQDDVFFDFNTILAIAAVVIGLPLYLIGTVFNKDLDSSDRALCGLAILPTVIYSLFYLAIFVAAPFVFMIVCFSCDAWPLGLLIGFFIVLAITSLFKNVVGRGKNKK